ncbi:hypothetical protein PLICRDRAFT_146236 [Plicaturopsis crispa FD-325 SS-3]|uniref:TAFII28-like protein domain-containing protein n=1 Tax=Plicaturopsis crispa FD-325 SS-3 TaxID=944288 RepID=A0A0C9T626_PLICR|nr:hypothetical protein PLICRDRAFT_146236 [Plicaturopsis crispa FD-325 SS-3]
MSQPPQSYDNAFTMPSTPGPSTPTPNPRGRPPGGAKRGRKPRIAALATPSAASPVAGPSGTPQQGPVQWTQPSTPIQNPPQGVDSANDAGSTATDPVVDPLLSLPGAPPPVQNAAAPAQEEDEDELLPAMADDDYSAQLSWQSQSKDNLKVLMDNFSPAQYDRFEAYRRHALPKQAVRKVIQQNLGQQISQPVAQIVAGFAKVFVGEIIEKARADQERRGDHGPLSPDNLRQAYRAYQQETGRVGAARPVRNKRLFVR